MHTKNSFDRTGWWPCAHSTGKFFLWLIGTFPPETSAPYEYRYDIIIVIIFVTFSPNRYDKIMSHFVIALSMSCVDPRFEHVCAYWRCERSNQNERNVCETYHNPVMQYDRIEPLVIYYSKGDGHFISSRYNLVQLFDTVVTLQIHFEFE